MPEEAMKCVAGPMDGLMVTIDAAAASVRVRNERRLAMTAPSGAAAGAAVASDRATTYTRRSLHCGSRTVVEFLAPEGITDEDAIRHQFSK